MLPSLLLRMQLVLLAWLVAIQAGRAFGSLIWWLCAITSAVLTVAQLPPFEFFTVLRDNSNYAQQFMLAIVSLIGCLIGLSGVVQRWRKAIMLLLATIGLGGSLAGYTQIVALMRGFSLSPQIGIGVVAWALCCSAIGLTVLAINKRG
jgi:hypothetical protein